MRCYLKYVPQSLNTIKSLPQGLAKLDVVGPVADVDLRVEGGAVVATLGYSTVVVTLVELTAVTVVRDVGAERAVAWWTTVRRVSCWVIVDRTW